MNQKELQEFMEKKLQESEKIKKELEKEIRKNENQQYHPLEKRHPFFIGDD